MKMTTLVLSAALTGLFSVNALAATLVNSGSGLEKVGTVSVSGPLTLSDLNSELAQKAQEAGASSYRIVAAGGENKLHGVAEIYK
jgi:multiple stress resistance protein BhsA